MKTAIFIISLIFLLSAGTVFAGNDLESPGINVSISENLLKILAPVTPKEANFDEDFSGMVKNSSIQSLAPTTPETAGFDEPTPTDIRVKEMIHLVSPKSSNEIDLNNTLEKRNNIRQFRPLTPKEASFEDIK